MPYPPGQLHDVAGATWKRAYTLELKDLRTIPVLVPEKPLVGWRMPPSQRLFSDRHGTDPANEIWKIEITGRRPGL